MSQMFVMQVEEVAEKLFVKELKLDYLVEKIRKQQMPGEELHEIQAVAKAALCAAAIFVAEIGSAKDANGELARKLAEDKKKG